MQPKKPISISDLDIQRPDELEPVFQHNRYNNDLNSIAVQRVLKRILEACKRLGYNPTHTDLREIHHQRAYNFFVLGTDSTSDLQSSIIYHFNHFNDSNNNIKAIKKAQANIRIAKYMYKYCIEHRCNLMFEKPKKYIKWFKRLNIDFNIRKDNATKLYKIYFANDFPGLAGRPFTITISKD